MKEKLLYHVSIVNLESFLFSNYFLIFIFESILNFVHPIPYIDSEYSVVFLGKSIIYRAQTFLYSFVFVKTYFIYKGIFSLSKFNSNFAEKYCEHSGCKDGYSFIAKCELKENPTVILIFSLCNIGVILGILIRFFEVMDENNKDNYLGFGNGIWQIYLSLTTVGYGELIISTHFGRIIIVAGVFLGTFLVSISIVIFVNISNLTTQENKAYSILNFYFIKDEVKNVAITIIKSAISKKITLKKQANLMNEYLRNTISEDRYKEENIILKEKYYLHKRTLYYERLRFNELNRSLNTEYFKNDDDKFIMLENSIDADIKIINNIINSLIQYNKFMQEQIEIQNKKLINQESMKNFILVIKNNYKFLLKNVLKSNNPNYMNETFIDANNKSVLNKSNINNSFKVNNVLTQKANNETANLENSNANLITDNKIIMFNKNNIISKNEKVEQQVIKALNPFELNSAKLFLNLIREKVPIEEFSNVTNSGLKNSKQINEGSNLYFYSHFNDNRINKLKKASFVTAETLKLIKKKYN